MDENLKFVLTVSGTVALVPALLIIVAWWRRIRWLAICGAIALVFVLLLAGAWWHSIRSAAGDFMPKDAELIQRFHRSRATLERLREMVEEDYFRAPGQGPWRIGLTYVDDKTLPQERVEEYRRLMREVGVVRVWASVQSQHITFASDLTGMLDVGAGKGFVYILQDKEPKIAPSLDESCMPPDSREGSCFAHRPLQGNWWLFRFEFR